MTQPLQRAARRNPMRHKASIIVAFAAVAACGESREDPRGVERDEVLLQVMSSGRTDTRPNEARFTAGVQTLAPTAAAASQGNNEVMNKVTAALERLGIKPDDVQTRQITLQRIDYGPERGRFQAHNVVEVRVRDLRRAGQAISVTTEAGANVVSGPNMTVADPEEASRSAYAQAFTSARARAETYAEAAGLKVSRVLSIRDAGETGVPDYHYGGPPPIARTASTVSPPPPPEEVPMRAGRNATEVRVRVDFALSER
jgi:uncharacterized protein YggE